MNFIIFRGALSWLLLIVSAPITFPIILSLRFAQTVVQGISKLSKFKRLGIKEPVVSLDSLFVIDDFKKNPIGANAIIWLIEGPIDLSKVCDRINLLVKRNEGYDRLHSLVPTANLFGFPFWTSVKSNGVEFKSTFKVNNHLLKETGEIRGNLELDKYLVKYLQRPFPKDQPCWDILYINNFQDENIASNIPRIKKSVLVFRNHHIVGDGKSMLNTLNRISDNWCGNKIKLDNAEERNNSSHRTCDTVLQLKDSVMTKFHKKLNFETFQHLYWVPLNFLSYTHQFMFHKDFATVKKESQELVLLRTEMSLDKFKRIRKENFGTEPLGSVGTQNWILSGTLRQLYQREFGNASAQFGSTRVVASLPWEDRKTPRNISQFKNRFTIGSFTMPLNEPCRLKRKDIVLQDCGIASKCRFPQGFLYFLRLNRLVPIAVLQSIFAFNMGYTGLLSNLKGPNHAVYIDKKKVLKSWIISGMQRPQGVMTNALYSYNGTMGTTFLIKKQFLPSENTSLLAKDFENEVESIITISKNTKDVKCCKK